jgi:hypothetical protein
MIHPVEFEKLPVEVHRMQGYRIQGHRMQVERREGYELQLVMAMVTGCQWDGATLALKSQQPVM